jgi:tRNA/tmRNA/rRNA uracil-C5-methylase (TrmA/RlmC/RlmD family)
LYYELGTISICLSSFLTEECSTIKCRGVELEPSAVNDAITNASLNQIHNVHYHCGKAEDILPNLLQDVSKEDIITAIVDPPRHGLRRFSNTK